MRTPKIEDAMKVFVVLNAAAGLESQASVRDAIARRLDASHIPYEVHETVEGDRLGDVVRAHLHNGFDLVVAAGGDGTVSGVVDGLVGSSIPLCIIPTGTGNLIARELGIPTTLDEAIAVIGGASGSRRFDAMRIGNRIFILNVSVGFSASVVSSATTRLKNRFGRSAYLWAILLRMFRWRSQYLAVAVDGMADEYRAIEVSVMNCGMVPKALYSKGPTIRVDDGHLDVFVLGMKTIRDYPSIIFNAVVGRSFDFLWRFIKVEKRATIRSNVPLQVQADGDIVGTTPIDIEVVPGAVTVLVPEEAGTAPIT
jgi:diacylglycerol kinase family enzyme